VGYSDPGSNAVLASAFDTASPFELRQRADHFWEDVTAVLQTVSLLFAYLGRCDARGPLDCLFAAVDPRLQACSLGHLGQQADYCWPLSDSASDVFFAASISAM